MGEAVGLEGFGRSVQTIYDLLYADDGIIFSPQTARLQAHFTC